MPINLSLLGISKKQAATWITSTARSLENLNPYIKSIVESGISELNEDPSTIKTEKNLSPSVPGLNSARSAEPICRYIKAEGERVLNNSNDAWIVLGRDRKDNLASGYGGAGHSGASSIDIVCGRGATAGADDSSYADPNFKSDAARIYISQKSDIDDYLSLVDGTVGNSKARSAIGMKADSIRLAARQGIKIVTNADDTNSFGGLLLGTKGIDLIAGNNEEELQPIPKGDNTVSALRKVNENISRLNGIVMNFILNQTAFNVALQAHTHAPSFGMAPSIELQPVGVFSNGQIISNIPNLWLNKVNTEFIFPMNYLYPFGTKYICGTNRTN